MKRPDFEYGVECGYWMCEFCDTPWYPMEVESEDDGRHLCPECMTALTRFENRKEQDMPDKRTATGRFEAAHKSYNYCGICGHVPRTRSDEPNRAPLRWWDPDDGWKIGTLCKWCAEEALDRQPKPDDYAVATKATNGVCDHEDTDEDPTEAL